MAFEIYLTKAVTLKKSKYDRNGKRNIQITRFLGRKFQAIYQKVSRTDKWNQYGHGIQDQYTQVNCIFMHLQWTTGDWN